MNERNTGLAAPQEALTIEEVDRKAGSYMSTIAQILSHNGTFRAVAPYLLTDAYFGKNSGNNIKFDIGKKTPGRYRFELSLDGKYMSIKNLQHAPDREERDGDHVNSVVFSRETRNYTSSPKRPSVTPGRISYYSRENGETFGSFVEVNNSEAIEYVEQFLEEFRKELH